MEKKKTPILVEFENVAMGFKTDYIFRGFTKTGNMKVTDIIGSSPQGVDPGKNRIAKLVKKDGEEYFKIFEGGSPLNTYIRRNKK